MRQILIKQGKIEIEEIPVPQVGPGMVLVNTRYSCISRGTEMSGLETSGTPIWKRALRQPEKAKTFPLFGKNLWKLDPQD